MKIRSGRVYGAIRRQLERTRDVNKWPHIIQDWLYPPTCLLCGDPGSDGLDLCRPCANSLPYIETACPRCALPLAAPEPQLCGACQRKPPAYDRAFALFHYDDRGPVGHLVKSLKFGARYPAARLLGTLLAEHLGERSDWPEAIIPVPLHRQRYQERGFNQAIEIGRTLSRRLGVPMDPTVCRRVRATAAQARLAGRERRRNLNQAFVVRPEPGYRTVAILDDVVTTGATVNEVALALRRAGVEAIEVWACARRGLSSKE